MDQGVEKQQLDNKKPAKPWRYYINMALLSTLCLSWFIIDHTLIPRRQSPIIAPSRLTHGFGIRLPVLGSGENDVVTNDERYISRNLTHFRLEYGMNNTYGINKTQNVKEILIYGSINNMLDFPEMLPILNLFKQEVGYTDGFSDTAHLICPDVTKSATNVVGVRVGTSPEYFMGKDVILFGMLPKALGDHHLDTINAIKPLPGQTWIYYSQEPPFRVMRWVKDPKLLDLRYHNLMTYNMDSEIPRPFGYYVANNILTTTATSAISNTIDRFTSEKVIGNLVNISRNTFEGPSIKKADNYVNISRNKTRLIAWMASNCEEVFWPRYDFIQQLMVHIHIDTYGRCGALNCLPRDSEQCNWKLNKYKFYLALANSECRHYITEKFWRTALKYNIVPVVYGAPKVDFERFAPPNSYIHAGDFDSPWELADYLLKVDANDTLYNSYFDWKRTGYIRSNFPPRPCLFCDILANLEKDSKSDESRPDGLQKMRLKLLKDSPWWRTCRHNVSISTVLNTRYQKLSSRYSLWKPWNVSNN